MMTESESVALPLGDAALTERIIADGGRIVKREKQKTFRGSRAGARAGTRRRGKDAVFSFAARFFVPLFPFAVFCCIMETNTAPAVFVGRLNASERTDYV